MFERNKTRPFLIRFAQYFYFLGSSLRNTSKAFEPFVDTSYLAIWHQIEEFNPKEVFADRKNRRITAYLSVAEIILGCTDL